MHYILNYLGKISRSFTLVVCLRISGPFPYACLDVHIHILFIYLHVSSGDSIHDLIITHAILLLGHVEMNKNFSTRSSQQLAEEIGHRFTTRLIGQNLV